MHTFFGRDTHVRPVSALVSSPHWNILELVHTIYIYIYIFQMNFQLEESSRWMFTQYDVDGTRSEPENQYFPSSPQLSATILHVQLYVKQYAWHLTYSHIYEDKSCWNCHGTHLELFKYTFKEWVASHRARVRPKCLAYVRMNDSHIWW